MMTQTPQAAINAVHADQYLRRKQVQPSHFAASPTQLGSLASRSRALFDFVQADRSDDFTSQFVLNRASRGCRA